MNTKKQKYCSMRDLCVWNRSIVTENISLSVKFNVEIILLYVECRNWNVSLKNYFSCNEKSEKKNKF